MSPAELGFDPEVDARPLKRALQRKAQNALAVAILVDELVAGRKRWPAGHDALDGARAAPYGRSPPTSDPRHLEMTETTGHAVEPMGRVERLLPLWVGLAMWAASGSD